MIYFLFIEEIDNDLFKTLLYIAAGITTTIIVLKAIDYYLISRRRKILFVHFYLIKSKLTRPQKQILENQFTFYKKLTPKHKMYFEHRVKAFMDSKRFISREKQPITDEVRVLIAATAVMLTFGFRDYSLPLLETILVYPKAFFSKMNNKMHIGEFNPKYKTLVVSWEGFKQGYDIGNDNLNLGIHEFSHAIHLNSLQDEHKGNASIFLNIYSELIDYLNAHKAIKDKLIKTRYFRAYAFTNQYEFIAVLIETFFETPNMFKSQFPKLYSYIKQMLNFKYAGY